MKLKYVCEVYEKDGNKFATVAKGVLIKVLEVTKKSVKIQWQINEEKPKFGYISHKQFMICVDNEQFVCSECSMFGNCIEKNPYKQACNDFVKMEE